MQRRHAGAEDPRQRTSARSGTSTTTTCATATQRDAASVCAELLIRVGNDFDDFARHLVALPPQIQEISEAAVSQGFASLVTDVDYLGSALPPHLAFHRR